MSLDREDRRTIGILLLSVALFIAGIWFSVFRFGECRRVHPLWYCVSE